MIVGIMQPYLFPYIGYWQLVSAVDVFVIYDDVNFIKQGYINKNYILINKEKKPFSLELLGASSNKHINTIQVGRNSHKIIKTIEQNYKKAQYFDNVFPLIEDILNQKEKNLAIFIAYSLEKISKYLDIDTKFVYSSSLKKNNDLKGEEKVIELCKQFKSTQYINAIGGQKLYSKEKFKEQNISLNFIDNQLVKYAQFDNDFIPYLSIIDILMFNDIDKIKEMLGVYKLL